MARFAWMAAFMVAGVLTAAEVPGQEATAVQGRIICCEQAKQRLLLLDWATDWTADTHGQWSWAAADAPDIAKEHVRWFGNPSDAKPMRGGTQVLATFSGGAVALIRLADKKVLFYASVGGNPHSADLLPDGSIVTGSSEGGYLRVYRIADDPAGFAGQPQYVQIPLHDAHGVVWDDKRNCLWALGGWELKRYGYQQEKQELVEEKAYKLPGGGEKAPGGHDLSFNGAGDRLLLSTNRSVYLFDPEQGTFDPCEPIHDWSGVKSISQLTPDGPLLVMRATESWWSDTLRLVGSGRSEVKRLPGARFYKARWWRAEE